MSFWADVRALREELQRQVAARNPQPLVAAVKAVHGQPENQPKKEPVKLTSQKVKAAPFGIVPAERMTAAEYRQMMGL